MNPSVVARPNLATAPVSIALREVLLAASTSGGSDVTVLILAWHTSQNDMTLAASSYEYNTKALVSKELDSYLSVLD